MKRSLISFFESCTAFDHDCVPLCGTGKSLHAIATIQSQTDDVMWNERARRGPPPTKFPKKFHDVLRKRINTYCCSCQSRLLRLCALRRTSKNKTLYVPCAFRALSLVDYFAGQYFLQRYSWRRPSVDQDSSKPRLEEGIKALNRACLRPNLNPDELLAPAPAVAPPSFTCDCCTRSDESDEDDPSTPLRCKGDSRLTRSAPPLVVGCTPAFRQNINDPKKAPL